MDQVVARWGELEVRFQWAEDRHRHTVLWHGPGRETPVPLLRSVEGNPRQPWPPSPVVQHLVDHSEKLGRPLLLGLGMTGPAHFSLALSAREQGGLCWEPAARCNSRPQKLGSSYEVLVPWELESPRQVRLQLPAHQEQPPVVLLLVAQDAPAAATAIQRTREGGIRLGPENLGTEFPNTITWAYCLLVRP